MTDITYGEGAKDASCLQGNVSYYSHGIAVFPFLKDNIEITITFDIMHGIFRSYHDYAVTKYARNQYSDKNFDEINVGYELVNVIQKSET